MILSGILGFLLGSIVGLILGAVGTYRFQLRNKSLMVTYEEQRLQDLSRLNAKLKEQFDEDVQLKEVTYEPKDKNS